MSERFADIVRDGTETPLCAQMVASLMRTSEGVTDGATCRIPDQKAVKVTEKAHVEHFTNLLLNSSDSEAVHFIDRLFRDGASANAVFANVLSPSARLLGALWQQDKCSFADVTLGLSAIHRVLYREADRLGREIGATSHDHAILITPLPGENHIFAASLLAEYFRAALWMVRSGIGESKSAIVQIVRRQPFDVVGITVSSVHKIPACKQLIGEIREHSLNPNVKILTGGPPFIENAVTCDDVNSDATALDAANAVRVAKAVCENSTQFRC